MLDIGLKVEIEKQGKLQDERLKKLRKEFEAFVTEKINEHNILSIELLNILNDLTYNEIKSRTVAMVQQKALMETNKNKQGNIIN